MLSLSYRGKCKNAVRHGGMGALKGLTVNGRNGESLGEHAN